MADFLERALQSHVQWKLKLLAAINEGAAVDRATAVADNLCEIGKWLYAEGRQYEAIEEYKVLMATHKRFHACVGHAIDLIAVGRLDDARNDIMKGAYKQASTETIDAINKLKAIVGAATRA